NLADPRLQDNLAAGGDRCAALGGADLNFGNPTPGLTIIDPAILEGWGVRESDWQFGVSVQREVLPRVGMEVGYNRRWFQNFLVTDNQLVGPADYQPWTLTAPRHPALPGGGGYPITLYNVTPAACARGAQNFQTFETNSRIGSEISEPGDIDSIRLPERDVRIMAAPKLHSGTCS